MAVDHTDRSSASEGTTAASDHEGRLGPATVASRRFSNVRAGTLQGCSEGEGSSLKAPNEQKAKKTALRPLTRSEHMGRVKGKNSLAERALRSALHAEGLRFRLHRRIEGVTVDIVFPRPKVGVFVDGCFWHGCPEHATFPKSNAAYWLPKLAENKERDRRQTDRLRAAGWTVIRVWGHDCLPPSARVVAAIVKACRLGGEDR